MNPEFGSALLRPLLWKSSSARYLCISLFTGFSKLKEKLSHGIQNQLQWRRTRPGTRKSTWSTQASREQGKLNKLLVTQSKICIIRVARNIVVKPNTQHSVFATKKPSGLLNIDIKLLRSSRQSTLTARGIMDESPERLFYILFSNFYNREVRLAKKTMVAHTTNTLRVIHAIDTVDRNMASIETPEANVNSNHFRSKRHEESNKTPFRPSRCLGCSLQTIGKSRNETITLHSSPEGRFPSTSARLARWNITLRHILCA